MTGWFAVIAADGHVNTGVSGFNTPSYNLSELATLKLINYKELEQ